MTSLNGDLALDDRILIFIPCYNCEKQVGRVVSQLGKLPAGFYSEAIVVDNISADNTVDAARDAFAQIVSPSWKVVRNRSNYNLGGSHKVAFNYAIDHGFTHVIVLHGDDQADIADFVPPVTAGLHREYDSLLGARFMRGSRLQGYSLYRTLGNYGLNAICGVLKRRWIADQGSGLNMYSARYLSSRFYRAFDNTLIFPNTMFLHGVVSKSKYKFVPISWREEDQVSNARAVQQALRVIKLFMAPPNAPRSDSAPAGTQEYAFDVVHAGGLGNA